MRSVCACLLLDCLVCLPAVVLFHPVSVLAPCVLCCSWLVFGVLSLDFPDVCISSHLPACCSLLAAKVCSSI